MGINVVIYARFSSHNQTEQSIEGQLKVCYEYAQRNGYNVVAEYIDRAISGTTDARPDFKRMIEDSKKRFFEYVLVYQLDRFARSRYDSAQYKYILKKNGVRVLSAKENISDDASGVLMEAVLEGMAEYYSVELSQKIRRGFEINAQKGLAVGGQHCLGYKVIDKRFTIDPETAPIVEKIFEMYLNRHTMADIINYLNANQVKTAYGNPYNKNSIRRILTNRRYIGEYIYKGQVMPTAVPAIIDKETFSEVQVLMAKNKTAPARAKAAEEEYILTTKLFCGQCKTAMTGICGTSHNNVVHQYYACGNARKKACSKKNVRKDFIENIVVEKIRELLTPKNIRKIAKEVVALSEKEHNTDNAARLKRLIKENETASANLLEAVKKGKAVDIILEELEKLKAEHETMQNELQLDNAQHPILKESEVVFFLTQFTKGDINDLKYRRALIDTFVNAAYLYDTDEGRNKKLTILCNTQDGQISLSIDEIEGSPNGRLVEAMGVEPMSEKSSA
jgi:DNA invertase Pin-like site-specific DNA recombinase